MKVKDCAVQIRGVSYKPTDLHSKLNDNSVTLFRANNIKDGEIIFDDVLYVDKKCVSDEQYLKKGDILICASSGSKALVGKAAQIDFNGEYTFGAFCKAVRPNKNDDAILGVFFQSHAYRRMISALSQGVNINNIRNEHIDNLELPFFTAEVKQKFINQIQIVTKSIACCQHLLQKLDTLVKSRFIEMFGDKSYPIVKTAEVCDFITKGTTPPSKDILANETDKTVPYLKVYNLSMTGELLFHQEPQYISKEVHEGKLSRSKVYPNDVLMNIVGPPLGKFAIVSDEYSEWNINQAIAIFRAKEKILPNFLLAALMQEKVLQPFLNQAVGVRQLNISLEQCRNLELILPPLEEQQRFVDFVQQVDKAKSVLQKLLEKQELLRAALIQEYFG